MDKVWLIRVVDGKPVGVPRMMKADPQTTLSAFKGPVRTPTGGWAFYYRSGRPPTFIRGVYSAAIDPATGKLLTTPRLVSQAADVTKRAQSPDFSRDGKHLAYYVAPEWRRWSGEPPPDGPEEIVVRSLETGQERQITLSPKVSAGGTIPPNLRPLEWLPIVRWNPDGRSILIRGRTEAGIFSLFQADATTGKVNPLIMGHPETATSDRQLPERETVEGEHVTWGEWSPDGKAVFYGLCHYRPDAEKAAQFTHWRVLMRNLQTGKDKEVCRNPAGDVGFCTLSVSPDGRHLLIGAPNALWICPTTGGEPRELLKLKPYVHGMEGFSQDVRNCVAWTPDGRYLLFQHRHSWWRISAEGGEPECLNELPRNFRLHISSPSDLRVHPDGRKIAFSASQSQEGITMIQMMQSVVSPERAKERCIANLRTIGEAIERYKGDHGEEPDWLSDLYPDYLQDKGLLLCPEDRRGGPGGPFVRLADPKMPCSYVYWFNNKAGFPGRLPVTIPPDQAGMTMKKAGGLQRKYFGGSVAIVDCRHHSPYLNLSCDGEIYECGRGIYKWGWWRQSPQAQAGLLSQLKKAMQSNPDTWPQQYDRLPNLLWLLEDRASLTELLKAHIEAHPGEAGESARQALDEIRKVTFIARSEDDAEEYGDGGMGPDNLTYPLGFVLVTPRLGGV